MEPKGAAMSRWADPKMNSTAAHRAEVLQ